MVFLVKVVFDNCCLELDCFGCDVSYLEKMVVLFLCIIYIEVIECLYELGFDDIVWGDDFGVLYEIVIVDSFEKLVFIIYYLKVIKLFYMLEDLEND